MLLLFRYQLVLGQRLGMDTLTKNGSQIRSRTIPIGSIEEPGHYPGTEQDLSNFISAHLKYPKTKNVQKGTVWVAFEVLENGKIENIRIMKRKDSSKNLREEYNKSALELAKSLPYFIPTKKLGKPVKSSYNLPINFK